MPYMDDLPEGLTVNTVEGLGKVDEVYRQPLLILQILLDNCL